MRVVIDGGSWANRRGYGRVTRELTSALGAHGRHRYTLVVDQTVDPATVPAGIDVVLVQTTVAPARAASADGARSPADMVRMSRALASAAADLVWFPTVYTFVPVVTRRPVVTFVQDAIAERFPELIFPSARARLFWTAKVAAATRLSTRILTLSEHAKRAIEAGLHVPASRIDVVPLAPADAFQFVDDTSAVDAAFRRIGVEPRTPIVVYVGGLAPHKNLARVIEAFAAVTGAPDLLDARLVLVGDHGADVFHSDEAGLRALAGGLAGTRVVFAGPLEDGALACLLSGARALILASMDEGFGLPLVEAAACGTPVIATTSSAAPEVLGDAALYVEPRDVGSIGAAIGRVLREPGLRVALGAEGAVRARELTWRRSAERLEEIFDAVARGGRA